MTTSAEEVGHFFVLLLTIFCKLMLNAGSLTVAASVFLQTFPLLI